MSRENDGAAVQDFAAIYERYFVEIYRYIAGRLGRDVADDLAAETFLVAYRKRDRLDPARGHVRPGPAQVLRKRLAVNGKQPIEPVNRVGFHLHDD